MIVMADWTSPEYAVLSSPWIGAGRQFPFEKVGHLGIFRRYMKGEQIIQAGQCVNHLFYLKSGRVKTVSIHHSGQKKTIWYIEAGCLFGETPLFNDKPCDYYFEAVVNCEVLLFTKEIVLTNLLVSCPEAALSVVASLARKVHFLSTQVEDCLYRKPVIRVAKLIYLIYQEQKRSGNKETSPLPITQEDIADVLGLHRVTVNQAVRFMKSGGILKSKTHHIVVKDLEQLHRLALEQSEPAVY
jgi:CRP-like cAMP-binding protein